MINEIDFLQHNTWSVIGLSHMSLSVMGPGKGECTVCACVGFEPHVEIVMPTQLGPSFKLLRTVLAIEDGIFVGPDKMIS